MRVKLSCDIVRDLLPLYQDEVCSAAARSAVEEHLAECPDCRNMMTQMSASGPEEALFAEKQQVLERQAGYFRRKGLTAGMILAAVLMVPMLVCLIVDIAAGGGLGWFFIVLASLLVVASLTVVPVLVPNNKCLCTLGAFTACLMLLLLVICLYSGGHWFFIAASACLFGLALIFLPFVVRNRDVSAFLGKKKAAAVFAADTLLFILMMLCIGLRSGPGFFRTAGSICLPVLAVLGALVWLFSSFAKNAAARWGLALMLTGTLLCFGLSFVQLFFGNGFVLPRFRLFTWNAGTAADNIRWLIFAFGLLAGSILVISGKRKEKRN